jgi:hypothetical protein
MISPGRVEKSTGIEQVTFHSPRDRSLYITCDPEAARGWLAPVVDVGSWLHRGLEFNQWRGCVLRVTTKFRTTWQRTSRGIMRCNCVDLIETGNVDANIFKLERGPSPEHKHPYDAQLISSISIHFYGTLRTLRLSGCVPI